MAKKDTKGNWIDSSGNKVPPKYVSLLDKKRDKMVEKLIKLADEENKRLVKLRQQCSDEIESYLKFAAKEAGVKRNDGGNYTFTSFSGYLQVEVKVGNFIDFDERLQFAKDKIDECIERWSEGANKNLATVVYDAFKVDKKGRIDTKRILGLRKLDIKDKTWNEAMDLIAKGVTIMSRKSYIIFRRRVKPDDMWEGISLDFARVGGVEDAK